MSTFDPDEDTDDEDEAWLQEHKAEFTQEPQLKGVGPSRPLISDQIRTRCPRCHDDVLMETIRSGLCVPCQISDFLG